MGLSQDLLDLADHLSRRERRKPRQASLRRAVSTAYYALFHLLIEDAIKRWSGHKNSRLGLARAFEQWPAVRKDPAADYYLIALLTGNRRRD